MSLGKLHEGGGGLFFSGKLGGVGLKFFSGRDSLSKKKFIWMVVSLGVKAKSFGWRRDC